MTEFLYPPGYLPGGPDVPIVDGGTGASDAATARDNLGVTAAIAAAIAGTDYKAACKYATTAALPAVVYANGSSGVGATLTGVSVGALSIDSASPAVGERILVKDQAAPAQNGIYTVTATGSGIAVFVMTRTTDFDQSADVEAGDATYIDTGTVNAGRTYVQTTPAPITFGTTAIVWSQIAGPGSILSGTGITVSGLTVALAAVADQRVLGNVSGGSAAPIPLTAAQIRTFLGTVALADGGTGSTTAADALVALTADPTGAAFTAPPLHPAMQRFHRALANRATAPVKILYVGDSEFDFSKIHNVVNAKLSTRFNPQNNPLPATGVVGAGTSFPGDKSYGIGNASPTTWTSSGAAGLNTGSVQNHRGAGGCALKMTDLQAVLLNGSAIFDQVKFTHLVPLAVSGAQTYDIKVDGVVVHTVSAAAAGTYTYVVPGSMAGHTLEIIAHGEILLDAVDFYRANHDAWIQPHAWVHTGYTTGDFNLCTDFAAALATLDPDLVILEPAINDADAATYYADMTTLLATVAANTTASRMLLLPNAVLGRTTWGGWRRMAQRMEAERSLALLDLSLVMPDLSVSDPLAYTSDGVHMQSTGGNGRDVWAGAIFAYLTGEAATGAYCVWESTSTYSGSPGIVRIMDSGGGGMAVNFYLSRADTQPVLSLASSPNTSLNGLLWGPGGTTVVDAWLVRTRPAVLSITDSLVFGTNTCAVTGARLATIAALTGAWTYNNGTAGVGATLTRTTNGALEDQDFVTPAAGNRLIVGFQANLFENGLYTITQLGTAGTPCILTRCGGADQAIDYAGGIMVLVSEGRAFGQTVLRSSPITVVMGTTGIRFSGPKRSDVTPVDVALGTLRDRTRYFSDFEELDAALLVATGAQQRIPGTAWSVQLVGTAATATQAQVTDTLPGVVDLATGSTNAGFASVRASIFGMTFLGASRWAGFGRIKIPTLATAAETFLVRWGLMTTITSGVLPTAGLYIATAVTTVAVASNGVNTNTFAGAGTLNVADTTGFPSVGTITVATGGTPATITYTGKTGTTFTGCTTTAGGGVLATGGFVNSTNWIAVAAHASTYTLTDTGIAVTTGYRMFTIVYDEAAATAYYFNASTLVATHTTNLPVADAGLGNGLEILKTVGTTSRSARADQMGFDFPDARTPFPVIQ